jgi:hypothetical protein
MASADIASVRVFPCLSVIQKRRKFRRLIQAEMGIFHYYDAEHPSKAVM